VVAADVDAERLAALEVDGDVRPAVVDLLDEAGTRRWAAQLLADHRRVDGLVHLVGGWRGGQPLATFDLADWDWLHDMLIRTLQHTSRAFHDALRAGDAGRLVIISSTQASAPTATNAAYAAAKAAADAWTLAVADSFSGSPAAAVILRVTALLTPAMREAEPGKAFTRYTPVADVADAVHDLWLTPAAELNGRIRPLTP
jgi:NADP-dependent 3-hydroxy acid dehydrogenase YdfG